MKKKIEFSPEYVVANALRFGLINLNWYRDKYNLQEQDDASALQQYLNDPDRWRSQPSIYFNADYYYKHNPDVAEARAHPLLHYLLHGEAEGRKPNALFDPVYYNARLLERGIRLPDGSLLEHFLQYHNEFGISPCSEFDPQVYFKLNQDLRDAQIEPLGHFLEFGKAEGRSASIITPDRTEGDVQQSALAFQALYAENPSRAWLGAKSEYFAGGGPAMDCPIVAQPQFSIVVPCWESDPWYLQQCLSSALMQSWRDFELIVVDDGSKKRPNRELFRKMERRGVRVVLLKQNSGISDASNTGASIARGQWLLFLDHDDLLHPHALKTLAAMIALHRQAVYLFSDCAKISANGEITSFHYKPGWDPLLLLTYMYAGQVQCIKRTLFEELGGFDRAFNGCQDHALALRVAEAGLPVRHVPQVLYFWRAIPGSTALAASAKPYAHVAAKKAIRSSLRKAGVNARPRAAPWAAPWAAKSYANFFNLVFPHQGPEVSIIIPTRDNITMLEALVASIRKKTLYQSYRILILVDQDVSLSILKRIRSLSTQVESGNYLDDRGHFSFSKKVNAGVRTSTSPYVLLLNDDTEVITPSWLSEMMGYAQMPNVAAVGAQLVYADGSVQHAGITVGLEGGRAGHLLKGLPAGSEGYLSYRSAARTVFGVTAACMLIARDKYLEIGGFDEKYFPLAYNDVDFCARLNEQGWRNVYAAGAHLYHHEGVTRQRRDHLHEMQTYLDKYRTYRDPYFSPNWSESDENIYPLRRTWVNLQQRGSGLLFVSHNALLQGATKILCELAQRLHGTGKPRLLLPSGQIRLKNIRDHFELDELNATITPQDTALIIAEKILQAELALMRANPTAVLCNTLLNLPVVLAAIRLGLHVLWLIHESEGAEFFANSHSLVAKLYLPQAMTGATHVVFVSNDCRMHYREFDVAANFSVIRNGVSQPTAEVWQIKPSVVRKKYGVNNEDFVLLTVGTLCERKAQQRLVLLAQFLENRNIKLKLFFVVVGPSSDGYGEEMEAQVARLGFYKTRFCFLGEIDDTSPCYRMADLFVFTSRMEAYPTVLTEALAHGLPVLSTPVEGARDILFHNSVGLVAPFDDLSPWVDFIQRLQDKKIHAEYVRSAREAATILPSWEQCVDSYRRLLPSDQGA